MLIGDTEQATSEGKSGPVETGLTRPVATDILGSSVLFKIFKTLTPFYYECMSNLV